MLYLAIESSCDETAAAVVYSPQGQDVFEIRSNLVASQIEIHARYGGVVPEIASRAHAETVAPLTQRALAEAGVTMEDIDAVAVTSEPGLIGALLVGVNFAKGLAYAYKKPLISVNHIRGHIAACFIEHKVKAPYAAFVASGGHTSLMYAESYTDYETVGRTRDDAIGEAFDKIGRVLGLTYPAGAEMDRLASLGNPDAYKLPGAAPLDDSLDFSFSGLKTYVINLLNTEKMRGTEIVKEDICASLTKAVTTSVVKRLKDAHRIYGYKTLCAAGGVMANSHLRSAMADFCKKENVELVMPSVSLCGDNAVMIAIAAKYEFEKGNIANLGLDGEPSSKHDRV